jgi:hypothetical protein
MDTSYFDKRTSEELPDAALYEARYEAEEAEEAEQEDAPRAPLPAESR